MSGSEASLELVRLTWPEARERFGPKLVCLLPIGATEPHGPHLPLDTDVTIARAQALRAAELFHERGVDALVLPPLAYGLTRFTEGFEGRVTLRPGTLWALLEDVVQSVEEQGVRHVVFVNAHLEPEHVKILRGVAADYADGPAHRARVLFADNTRRRWAEALGGEFQSGDCHAGRYESSIVLAADPGAVREDARARLEPVKIDLIEKMRAGVKSFQAAGAEDAYCGDPASASPEEGRSHLDTLASLTVDSALEAWPHLIP
ncbi:MAG TPA: creatininase family protein [Planctomycetes bacterium]|nr:creatininase family protein [Planctomycetota bacterium]